MFTGIIEKIGTVSRVKHEANGSRIEIQTGFSDLTLGESVAVNGVCLTVAELTSGQKADFYLSSETLERTTFSDLKPGSKVGLERALPANGRLSGHFVQGHVDGKARVEEIMPRGDSFFLKVSVPANVFHYCVEKGSIALNGVSLTVNSVAGAGTLSPNTLSLMLVPHTWKNTTFSDLKTGDSVHVEIDILAKYVERLCQPSQQH